MGIDENIVGDASLLGAGLMNGRSKEIAAGTLYTAGATVLARYGNTKTEYHVKQVLEETADFVVGRYRVDSLG